MRSDCLERGLLLICRTRWAASLARRECFASTDDVRVNAVKRNIAGASPQVNSHLVERGRECRVGFCDELHGVFNLLLIGETFGFASGNHALPVGWVNNFFNL